MNIISFDNIISDPKKYVEEIVSIGFEDITYGPDTFKNIQPRSNDDEFAQYVTSLFSAYEVEFNFVRKSPLGQEEPNYIHTDEMMGDITCILYLNEYAPESDGTTIYDEYHKPLFTMYSKFNRMIGFNSDEPHSRNIFENFGLDESARLIQVIFLKHKQ